MEPFFQEFIGRLNDLHNDVKKALEGLTQESLDFKPAEDIPSICVLVIHLTGAERYWIGDVATMDHTGRNRESEFQAKGLSAFELRKQLDSSIEYTRKQLGSMTMQELVEPRNSPRDDRQFTVSWALLHALEHTAIHLGHIQIIRQLWHYKYP